MTFTHNQYIRPSLQHRALSNMRTTRVYDYVLSLGLNYEKRVEHFVAHSVWPKVDDHSGGVLASPCPCSSIDMVVFLDDEKKTNVVYCEGASYEDVIDSLQDLRGDYVYLTLDLSTRRSSLPLEDDGTWGKEKSWNVVFAVHVNDLVRELEQLTHFSCAVECVVDGLYKFIDDNVDLVSPRTFLGLGNSQRVVFERKDTSGAACPVPSY